MEKTLKGKMTRGRHRSLRELEKIQQTEKFESANFKNVKINKIS